MTYLKNIIAVEILASFPHLLVIAINAIADSIGGQHHCPMDQQALSQSYPLD
jgi:hypothetical protein